MLLDTWSARASVGAQAERTLLVVWIAVCVLGFLTLAQLATSGAIDRIDHAALDWSTARRTPLRSEIAGMVSFFGTGLALAVATSLIVIALWSRNRRSDALEVVVASVAAGFLTPALKLVLARPRPPIIAQLLPVDGFSFPSGHSSGMAALLTATALASIAMATTRQRRVLIVLLHVVVAVAVGASRVYLGAHYPSDVAAGLTLGLACGLGAHAVIARPRATRARAAAHASEPHGAASHERRPSGGATDRATPPGSAPPSRARTRRGSSPADRS